MVHTTYKFAQPMQLGGLNIQPSLQRVPRYVAGKTADEVREELGLTHILKLNSNENPLGTSPLALAAFLAGLSEVNRYPGVAERELRRKLVLHFGAGLTEQHFLVGNGATDILRMIAQGFILENSEAISCRISFPMYASLTIMFGGIPVSVDPLPNYGYDLDAICEAVTERTSVIWLCSPNNPTGLILSKEALDGLLRRIPEHVLVVIDESYCDFICEPYRPNSLEYVTSGANVILVRSFSKIYGLANLRVGYGIARPELVDYLGYCVLPFNSGAPALQAAAASLDDTEFLKRSCELIRQEREYVSTELKRMGLRCLPSQANFILVIDPPVEVHTIVDSLLRQGIAVRPMAGFGLPNAFRVTLGLHEQNQCFLEALQTILQ